MEAVMALERFATPATRLALTDIIENENCFYKVRCDAAYCLAKVDFLSMNFKFYIS
jgi:transcription initiation factor TFIID subunit 2